MDGERRVPTYNPKDASQSNRPMEFVQSSTEMSALAVTYRNFRRQGIMATMRDGPPVPPSIFIGATNTKKPFAGKRSRLATFSSA